MWFRAFTVAQFDVFCRLRCLYICSSLGWYILFLALRRYRRISFVKVGDWNIFYVRFFSNISSIVTYLPSPLPLYHDTFVCTLLNILKRTYVVIWWHFYCFLNCCVAIKSDSSFPCTIVYPVFHRIYNSKSLDLRSFLYS